MTIITLFLLMGTAFVIVSQNYLRSARERGKIRNRGDNPINLVNRVLFDVLRGPAIDNDQSPLRYHSILGDIYGHEGFRESVDLSSLKGSRKKL